MSLPHGPVVDLRAHLPRKVDPTDSQTISEAIDEALGEVARLGGGTLQIPPGDWLVRNPFGNQTRPAIHVSHPGTRIRGAGIRATRLRLDPIQHTGLLVCSAPGCAVERMTLTGNWDPGVERLQSGVNARNQPTFFSMTDVVLEDMLGYALFLNMQHDIDRAFANIAISNVTVDRCGGDGIDLKLVADRANRPRVPAQVPALGPRVFFRHISVEGHSALMPDKAGENAIDVRGQIMVQGFEALDVRPGKPGSAPRGAGAGAAAINFRDEATNLGDREVSHHGDGAAGSTLEGYYFSLLPQQEDEAKPRGVRVREFYADTVAVDVGATRYARLHKKRKARGSGSARVDPDANALKRKGTGLKERGAAVREQGVDVQGTTEAVRRQARSLGRQARKVARRTKRIVTSEGGLERTARGVTRRAKRVANAEGGAKGKARALQREARAVADRLQR